MIGNRDQEFTGTVLAAYASIGRRADQVSPDELEGWVQWCRAGDEVGPDDARTGERLFAIFAATPEGIAYRARPVPPPVPSLTVQGLDFVQDGQRIVLNGTDQFCAYRQYLDGVDLGPLFDESHALRFNLWRVFLMGSKAQNGILQLSPDARFFDMLRPFVDVVNAHGIVLLATVFVDAQDIVRDGGARQVHWAQVANELRGSATLLSGGNEWRKNGFDPGGLVDPGMPWSRGSNVADDMPWTPTGSFAEFHPRRDLPAALMDTVASAVFIRKTVNVPLIIDEPPRMGADGSGAEYADPFTCWKFARHYATECAGAVFHSRAGQQGVVMDAQTRACAEAWSRGMVIA